MRPINVCAYDERFLNKVFFQLCLAFESNRKRQEQKKKLNIHAVTVIV